MWKLHHHPVLSMHSSSEQRFAETNIFLVDILVSLLSSDAGWENDKSVESTTKELASLSQLQHALANMGAIDTIIYLISSACNYEVLPSHQRQTTHKIVELAYELVHYGPRDLQDRFIDLIEQKRLGYDASKNFMASLKAQLRIFATDVKHSVERLTIKDVKQEEKRMQRLDLFISRCTMLLLLLKMLCENHNARVQASHCTDKLVPNLELHPLTHSILSTAIQEYMRLQSNTRNVDLVALTVKFLADITEPLPETFQYVNLSLNAKMILIHPQDRAGIGETIASSGGLSKVLHFQLILVLRGDIKSLALWS